MKIHQWWIHWNHKCHYKLIFLLFEFSIVSAHWMWFHVHLFNDLLGLIRRQLLSWTWIHRHRLFNFGFCFSFHVSPRDRIIPTNGFLDIFFLKRGLTAGSTKDFFVMLYLVQSLRLLCQSVLVILFDYAESAQPHLLRLTLSQKFCALVHLLHVF